ncbi:Nitrilase [Lasiodiplodia theobromae]|uniref:Nitrilase n=1 Tax=Lasiodiplodia theobromae TaxID=45133 RepID=UPI0015C36F95|nr:Nitrilase [Lasiodiplodia theobromae]KAF4546484.1 Nitrilase [Lasiodiplodia theobromae]
MTATERAAAPTMNHKAQVKIAAAQIAPVFMNKAATTAKVCKMIREAGEQGAKVIGFPECCIPGYPGWGQTQLAGGAKAIGLYKQQFYESVEVPGPETDLIAQACREASMYAVVGINERLANTTGTTFNTQIIIDPNGEIVNKHQKYVPTVTERLVHAPGGTGTTVSTKTEFGTLSGLICGENCNPMALYSLSLEYPTVHVASWPAHFGPGSSTQEDILAVTKGMAYNLGCFIINSVSINCDSTIDAYTWDSAEAREWMLSQRELDHTGGARATILDPSGKLLAGPLPAGEGILYADANIEDVLVNKFMVDVAGHYQRPELFAHHFEKYIKK